MAFLLHLKDGTNNIPTNVVFVLSFTRSIVLNYPTPFTFPQTSKCFLSNGNKNMHTLASGPDLQAVRFGYVILGKI
jgi:hypothetical protein